MVMNLKHRHDKSLSSILAFKKKRIDAWIKKFQKGKKVEDW
jgi:hypothetical protein